MEESHRHIEQWVRHKSLHTRWFITLNSRSDKINLWCWSENSGYLRGTCLGKGMKETLGIWKCPITWCRSLLSRPLHNHKVIKLHNLKISASYVLCHMYVWPQLKNEESKRASFNLSFFSSSCFVLFSFLYFVISSFSLHPYRSWW